MQFLFIERVLKFCTRVLMIINKCQFQILNNKMESKQSKSTLQLKKPS